MSYCVRDKRKTPDKPGSAHPFVAKNGTNMVRSICAVCGGKKTAIVGRTSGGKLPSVRELWRKTFGEGVFQKGHMPKRRRGNGQKKKKTLDQIPVYEISGRGIHKIIGWLPRPKRGFTLPGHNYTGPYNPLEKQAVWDDEGNITHFIQRPTGATDAIAAQHDVDYDICEKKKGGVKCQNVADRKMVKDLDDVPKNKRQWGHTLARNAINTKQKLGMGLGQKEEKKRR